MSAKAALAYRSIALAGSPDAALRAGLAAIRELTSAAAAVWVSRIDGLPFSVVDQVGLEPGGLAAWSGAGPHLAELIQSNGGPLTFHSDRAERDGGLPRVLSTRARHDVIGIPSSRSDNAVVMCVVERDRAPDIGLDGDDWPAEVADIIGFTDDRRAELTESQLLRDGVVALEKRLADGARTAAAVEAMAAALLRGENLAQALARASAPLGVALEVERIIRTDTLGPREEAPTEREASAHRSSALVPGVDGVHIVVEADMPTTSQSLKAVAMISGLELSRQRAILETEHRLTDALIRSLVEGDRSELQRLWQRAALVGIDLSRARVPVALGDGTPVDREMLDHVTETIRGRLNTVEVTSYEGAIIVLWPIGDGTSPTALAHDVEAMLRELRPYTLRAGIGSACTRSHHYPDAVREALFCFNLALRDGTGPQIVCAEDLGLYRLFAHIGGVDTLNAAVRETLGPLIESDREDGSNLVGTLRVFLQNDRRMAETARGLFLHVNSLRYRIERIERLLGVDLGDSDVRFKLQLALRLEPVVGGTEQLS